MKKCFIRSVLTACLSLPLVLASCTPDHDISDIGSKEASGDCNSVTVSDDASQYQPCLPDGTGEWALTFQDEFNGTVLDSSKWCAAPEGARRDGVWCEELAFPSGDGELIIRTEMRDGKPWSGAIRTYRKFLQAGGYFEIRCVFPSQEGMWHAFWLMCGSVLSEENGSTDGIEIDIMEYLPALGGVNLAVHWDGYGSAHKSDNSFIEDAVFADGYHTFGMMWDSDGYTFYIDSVKVWNTKADGVCTSPGYMKLTTEVGEWGGSVDPDSLPADWKIDYVRVYEHK
ncbi:MAG TPA: glycoside hydrolase family 16 protein [Bacillota bacterium]|nr:glycoside hydrolase family 16 protein [Bacillota bacterium]